MHPIEKFPLLVIFGLDYTLWPYHAANVHPPIKRTRSKQLIDSDNMILHCYRDVPAIFERLRDEDVMIAVGTTDIHVYMMESLLDVFDLEKYISYKELLWLSFENVFESLHNYTKIAYADMLFFEDKHENIESISKMGVPCVHVQQGMDMTVFEDGLTYYRETKAQAKTKIKE